MRNMVFKTPIVFLSLIRFFVIRKQIFLNRILFVIIRKFPHTQIRFLNKILLREFEHGGIYFAHSGILFIIIGFF